MISFEYKELLQNLVSRELKGQYKGSALGFLWSILTPLFMAIVYVFFLRLLVGRGVPTEEIIIGVFAWQFTAQCVNGGMASISGNSNLVKKVFFPRALLPTAMTLAQLINYLLSFVVQIVLVFVFLHLRQDTFNGWILLLPLLIVYHAIMNLGIAFFVSSLNVYFRDLQHIIGVLLSAWFFASPAMYNLSFVERFTTNMPWALDAYMLNPAACIITGYRAAMLPSVDFPWSTCAVIGCVAPLLFLLISYKMFQRLQKNFADLL